MPSTHACVKAPALRSGPLRGGYADPRALGELVLSDLTRFIEAVYPLETSPDPLARERGDAAEANQTRLARLQQDFTDMRDGASVTRLWTLVSDLDPDLLREIARQTHGGFFRAEERDTLASAFKAIDATQKVDLKEKHHVVTTELFPWLAAPGLALLFAGALLALAPGASP